MKTAKHRLCLLCSTAIFVFLYSGCGGPLPSDFPDYENECILMTPTAIPPTEDDPHEGHKKVYACGITEEALILRQENNDPYPDGTMIIKESQKDTQSAPWLVAIAEKKNGEWEWAEYTRNFADQEYLKAPIGEDTCIGCHKDAKNADYIFTGYLEE